jgi:hypothetical protein
MTDEEAKKWLWHKCFAVDELGGYIFTLWAMMDEYIPIFSQDVMDTLAKTRQCFVALGDILEDASEFEDDKTMSASQIREWLTEHLKSALGEEKGDTNDNN